MVLPNIDFIHGSFAQGIGWYIKTMNDSIRLLFQYFQIKERFYVLGIAGLSYYYFCLFVCSYWLLNKSPKSILLLLLGTSLYSIIKLFSL
jgi:hypothetical protein